MDDCVNISGVIKLKLQMIKCLSFSLKADYPEYRFAILFPPNKKSRF